MANNPTSHFRGCKRDVLRLYSMAYIDVFTWQGSCLVSEALTRWLNDCFKGLSDTAGRRRLLTVF